ncbi:galactose-6-phosphate isomerase subunit LacA [Lentibacillus salinarum]|uniref:Galactose-6-phosphate isomerase subunit LacA n=1 Tax=Lentibacillus salinarum TaxID=446820 RepID=A0ABW3ZVV6_9BACI
MTVIIGSDRDGFTFKESLKVFLEKEGYNVLDVTPKSNVNFVESSMLVGKGITEGKADKGILIDRYGVGSFMSVNKIEGIIAAEVSDEHSTKMTCDHNNASIITLGSGIVGMDLAKNIASTFLESSYSGGRHQIRVDMLNKL